MVWTGKQNSVFSWAQRCFNFLYLRLCTSEYDYPLSSFFSLLFFIKVLENSYFVFHVFHCLLLQKTIQERFCILWSSNWRLGWADVGTKSQIFHFNLLSFYCTAIGLTKYRNLTASNNKKRGSYIWTRSWIPFWCVAWTPWRVSFPSTFQQWKDTGVALGESRWDHLALPQSLTHQITPLSVVGTLCDCCSNLDRCWWVFKW